MWLCVGKTASDSSSNGDLSNRNEDLHPVRYSSVDKLLEKPRQVFHDLVQGAVKLRHREAGIALFANFAIPEDLLCELVALSRMVLRGSESDTYDVETMRALVARQRRCQDIFESLQAAVFLSPKEVVDGDLGASGDLYYPLARGESLLQRSDGTFSRTTTEVLERERFFS